MSAVKNTGMLTGKRPMFVAVARIVDKPKLHFICRSAQRAYYARILLQSEFTPRR